MELSTAGKGRLEEINARYPNRKAALLPTLFLYQEGKGYLSLPVLEEVARRLELPPTDVYQVATFYTMFNLRPVGQYHIQVCNNLSCSLMGAERIVEHLEQRLGMSTGETTSDGLFTLSEVQCLASCGSAPMMQINDDYHENLTLEKVDEIIDTLRRQGKGAS